MEAFNGFVLGFLGDALWAGLPIVTLPGESMQSRVCASIIKAAGSGFEDEMIASSLQDYEEKAYNLVTKQVIHSCS